jgi:hypothetical protein
MGVFCIEVTANDESISYIFEKVNIPLSFDVMLRRTIQTNHGNVKCHENIVTYIRCGATNNSTWIRIGYRIYSLWILQLLHRLQLHSAL